MFSQKHFVLLAFASFMATALPAHAVTIQEVTSESGIKAWLVQDHKLPLISMQFGFHGGVEQDPMDKQGLANLTMELLTEGAGTYNAEAFQQELATHSIGMSFEASRDYLFGSVKTLKTERDTAFNLLHLALTKPRFDANAVERTRARAMTALKNQLGNPGWQSHYAMFHQIFGAHPYGERRIGTMQTLSSLTREDIHRFATQHLARDGLIVAVAGDITPAELSALLDHVFGDLPKAAKLASIPEIVWPQETPTILVPREGTQTALFFAMPGPKREDTDWYATEIANYILGGGGFSARLMNEVRDKNGLTYGISTGLSAMEHGGMIVGEAATDNPKTRKAWSITSETIRNFYEDGVTEKEINAAKDYLTGALPLTMTSTDKIAGALVSMQVEHLGIDYMERYNDLIRSVTPDEIAHAIKKWFKPDRITLVMVGKPEGMTPTQTQDPVRK